MSSYGTETYQPVAPPRNEDEFWRPSPHDQILPRRNQDNDNEDTDEKARRFVYPLLGILAIVYAIVSTAILGFTGHTVMIMFTWVSFVIFFGISVAACTYKYYNDRDIEGGVWQKAVDSSSSAFWWRVLAALCIVYMYLFLFVALDGGFTEKNEGFIAFTICFSGGILFVWLMIKWYCSKKDRDTLRGVV